MSRYRDHRSRIRFRLLTTLASASLAACGGSIGMSGPTTTTTPPPTATATIDATPQIAFSPAQVSVTQGATVTFSFGSVAHNVYFDNDPSGAPGNIPGVNSNTSVARVFATAGVFNYYCHIHPGMHGTITVVAPDYAVIR